MVIIKVRSGADMKVRIPNTAGRYSGGPQVCRHLLVALFLISLDFPLLGIKYVNWGGRD
jgi:hypothetical protein